MLNQAFDSRATLTSPSLRCDAVDDEGKMREERTCVIFKKEPWSSRRLRSVRSKVGRVKLRRGDDGEGDAEERNC